MIKLFNNLFLGYDFSARAAGNREVIQELLIGVYSVGFACDARNKLRTIQIKTARSKTGPFQFARITASMDNTMADDSRLRLTRHNKASGKPATYEYRPGFRRRPGSWGRPRNEY